MHHKTSVCSLSAVVCEWDMLDTERQERRLSTCAGRGSRFWKWWWRWKITHVSHHVAKLKHVAANIWCQPSLGNAHHNRFWIKLMSFSPHCTHHAQMINLHLLLLTKQSALFLGQKVRGQCTHTMWTLRWVAQVVPFTIYLMTIS